MHLGYPYVFFKAESQFDVKKLIRTNTATLIQQFLDKAQKKIKNDPNV